MAIDWLAQAQALRSELVARRRALHRHPELAFEERRTASLVAAELSALGLEVQTGVGKTGVVGVLEGAHDGTTVLVRCDMDALPIHEANTAEYASQTPNTMHACGHDGHVAIGLGVAKLLAARRDQLAGRVKFVFQPAEEIAAGANAMIADGVLEAPAPQVALGLHLWNNMPVGTVGVTEGAAMASANDFTVTVRGVGGHGALPDETRDPIFAAAQIISALQSVVSRNVSGLDTAALSVCTIHGGDAMNVIPSEVTFGGTFRTYQPATNELVTRRLREIAEGVAAALGCTAEVRAQQLTPPLINDSAVNARLREAFKRVAPHLTLVDNARTMASEDMACFLERVRGTFFFVGSANRERGLDFPHHHPRFDFDEEALPLGAGLLAAAVAEYVLPSA
ncbi:MAG: M20 family metallopeptidase [Aggregatilineales bacterium]